jgi:hypothetical protein
MNMCVHRVYKLTVKKVRLCAESLKAKASGTAQRACPTESAEPG